MAVSEPRPQPAVSPPAVSPWGGRVVWGLIGVLGLLFVGLMIYRIRSHDRHEQDVERVAELQTATPNPRAASTSAGADWPQWRGHHRDGVSTETGLLAAWPDDGPKVLWSRPTGDGYSSVVVAHGRAITMLQDGENEAVVCWDAATGDELWRFRYAAHFRHSTYHDGPRSTPAIAGEHVYTVGGTGVMHCLKLFPPTAAGAAVWRKDLLGEFGGPLLDWGISFSPLVDDGLVYVMPGGPDGKALAALDQASGRVVWHGFDDRASYSSPMAADFAGSRQIVFLTGDRLLGVAPDTGKMHWEFAWPSGPVHTPSSIMTPLVIHRDVGDYVFLASGYDKGCGLIKIERDGNGFCARQVYRNRNLRSVFTSPVCLGDYIYGFDDTNLACIDLRNGQRRWREDGFGKGSLMLVDGHLIIHGDEGVLALAAADPGAYRELGRVEPSEPQRMSWTVPTLAAGRLYVRNRTRLVCYELKKPG